MAKKIYLSPSNQSENTYASGNTTEMEQCDKIARAAANALQRCGFTVKVGRSGDTIANRCRESDAFGADIHMPIHTNAYNGAVTGGTRIFCYGTESRNMNPCKAVLKELGAISPGMADSVTVNSGLYEVNTPKAVTVYVECEFHDTKTGANWIINNITNIGEAIARGLCSYFGYTYSSGQSGPSSNTPVPDVIYQVYTKSSGWLPNVKNTEDYAGLPNQRIRCVYANLTKGSLMYRVHTLNGRWLPWVTDREDYAGLYGSDIDCVCVKLEDNSNYSVQCRVAPVGGDYYPWVTDNNDYAGVYGMPVDRLQIRIIKK